MNYETISSFGTQGSKVQILSLRPFFPKFLNKIATVRFYRTLVTGALLAHFILFSNTTHADDGIAATVINAAMPVIGALTESDDDN